ncbi:hypothetical protein EOL73_02220 [Candidatus Saccharibacteria bacterium]|nr:hypothetical protein [Candidatus Saccharibacteria bacterium]NCU40553.1 hypothetical protein [Candidatus Saccharibacteria bacterium]
MYFQSRAEAGVMLASKLMKYRYDNTVIVALSDGSVQVGMQIAAELHATLSLLLTLPVDIPGEDTFYGMITQEGGMVYNSDLTEGQVDDYYSEYRGNIEEQKISQNSKLNKLLGSGGILEPDILRGQNVVLLSDGLNNTREIDVALELTKPLKIERLIIASPVASISAVDKAHISADEVCFLSVTPNFIDTDHYYDVNDMPNHEEVLKMLNEFVMRWR